jgi:hypothetical protein
MPASFVISPTPAMPFHGRRLALALGFSIVVLGLTACMQAPTKGENTAATPSLLDQLPASSIRKPIGSEDYPRKQAKLKRLVLRTLKYDYEIVDIRFTMTSPPTNWNSVYKGANSILSSTLGAQHDRQLHGELGDNTVMEFWRLPDRPDTLIAVGKINHFLPGKSHHGENRHMIIGYFELRKKR